MSARAVELKRPGLDGALASLIPILFVHDIPPSVRAVPVSGMSPSLPSTRSDRTPD